ncbi:MAG TPA: DUF4384 domain-containing protein [Spirochaetia bacterium]
MKRGVAVIVMLLVAAACAVGQGTGVSFTWAFVKQGPDGRPVPVDFSEKVAVAKGDLFKIFLRPSAGTFVYLFLQDAQGELTVLYPESWDVLDGGAYAKTRTFIPPGDDWFTLDAARGTEHVHLLASSTRLAALEAKVTAWRKSPGPAARQAVLDEIARVRKAHSQVAMGAEKPVTIAGGTRAIGNEMEKEAVRIDAKEFYTRTFRLEH